MMIRSPLKCHTGTDNLASTPGAELAPEILGDILKHFYRAA